MVCGDPCGDDVGRSDRRDIGVHVRAGSLEGHGTDTAVRAFHWQGGFIRKRVPPLKMIASAITIGSGGAGGREGPTALISAGFGSIYATWTHRDEAERGSWC